MAVLGFVLAIVLLKVGTMEWIPLVFPWGTPDQRLYTDGKSSRAV
jgi:hypothetical protein